MTELEFEKACRGPVAPVADEYAWGSANIQNWLQYSLAQTGTSSEYVTNPGTNAGNANHTGSDLQSQINGPLRCGIFAASTTNPTREESGATYYGIMEMSGNVVERAVSIGFSQGRAYTGSHGDGLIDSLGMANQADWPDPVLGFGSALRGGSFFNGDVRIRTSDRFENHQPHIWRLQWRGWRGIRSAP